MVAACELTQFAWSAAHGLLPHLHGESYMAADGTSCSLCNALHAWEVVAFSRFPPANSFERTTLFRVVRIGKETLKRFRTADFCTASWVGRGDLQLLARALPFSFLDARDPCVMEWKMHRRSSSCASAGKSRLGQHS